GASRNPDDRLSEPAVSRRPRHARSPRQPAPHPGDHHPRCQRHRAAARQRPGIWACHGDLRDRGMTAMDPSDYEKLGQFYLGREYDLEKKSSAAGNLVLYDSKDLVTHAIVVGMTGSGKTGLCIDLIEEAAIDGVPAIAIDPKGDLTNLLLTFPDLRPEDFRPWINEDDAARKGLSPDDFAKQQAELWPHGLG